MATGERITCFSRPVRGNDEDIEVCRRGHAIVKGIQTFKQKSEFNKFFLICRCPL